MQTRHNMTLLSKLKTRIYMLKWSCGVFSSVKYCISLIFDPYQNVSNNGFHQYVEESSRYAYLNQTLPSFHSSSIALACCRLLRVTSLQKAVTWSSLASATILFDLRRLRWRRSLQRLTQMTTRSIVSSTTSSSVIIDRPSHRPDWPPKSEMRNSSWKRAVRTCCQHPPNESNAMYVYTSNTKVKDILYGLNDTMPIHAYITINSIRPALFKTS